MILLKNKIYFTILFLICFIFGILCLKYGINEYNIMNKLKYSNNKYIATIVNVETSRGTKNLYIEFKINGIDKIYKGKKNFSRYINIIYIGKEITVIFDGKNEKYIIENFQEDYFNDYWLLIILGIIPISITIISIILIIRVYLK